MLLDLADFPLFVAIAFATAWVLTALLARPLRDLTAASEAMTRKRLPSLVDVPRGDDELARLARSLNHMSRTVHGHFERERAFSQYASHELRTPLSVLRIQIERAQLGIAEPASVLPTLEQNVRRMEDVLEGLLALARSSRRDEDPRMLGAVLQGALASLPSERKQRVRLVDNECERRLVRDDLLLQRALDNLVDNALRHSTGAATVLVRTDRKDLIVEVTDAGPGVPEDELCRLTQPFYRAGSTREGIGLGLALVRVIAEGLEGDFHLSNSGKGLTASLRLPIVISAQAQLQQFEV